MPCYEPRDVGPYIQTVTEYRDNPKTDELLCSACRALVRLGYDLNENPDLCKWWFYHQQEDEAKEKARAAKRIRAEAAKECAAKPFNTLTPQEKELLRSEGYL